jgi:hypothetical protein
MKALYCHPIPIDEWPAGTEVVERVELRSCRRRGAAIDVVATRARENRSQLVYTTARGREVVFWQSPRTRKQSRPGVRVPSARAAGLAELVIVVDAHERYGYDFADKPVTTVRRGLSCGDYGLLIDGRLVAAVERKSLPDLVASLLDGTLKYQLTELAALPRAVVVVETTAIRRSSSWFMPGPRWSPTGSPNCRSVSRPWRSCSARPADWPRNTPTAIWRRPTRG